MEPDNKAKLTGILTYHVVSGKFAAADVLSAINANNGKYTVTTVQGGSIDLSLNGGKVILTDANGGTSTVVMADVAASNGFALGDCSARRYMRSIFEKHNGSKLGIKQ